MENANIFTGKEDVAQGLFIYTNDSGEYLHAYDDDATRGYVVLMERIRKKTRMLTGTKVEKSSRSCIYNGDLDMLADEIKEWETAGRIPGRIVIQEMVHDDLPVGVAKMKSLKDYEKKAGSGGCNLTLKGQKIYMFKNYDETGLEPDVFIAHDNNEEVTKDRDKRRKEEDNKSSLDTTEADI
jgi:hypothetical protein